MTRMQSLPDPAPTFQAVADFALTTRFEDIPKPVTDFAALLLLDLVGVAAAATPLPAGRIARDHAARFWAPGAGAPAAHLLFDGRPVSPPGAAFALATQIDNLDAHDGYQPSKGHAGAALLPALIALAPEGLSGRAALTALVVGYEVAYRAAVALHATTADYHTSGAWNALGCVAIAARLIGLDRSALRHAFGIAEFHGPRSQMMREIANPTMLHDGTGWGAPVGVASALLAAGGFTGAPAALVEFDDAASVWGDLGSAWLTPQQYIKPYPICRWAHAPIDAALALRADHGLTADRIAAVEIAAFREATELYNGVPGDTARAQYSLAWPVAAALARGRVGVAEITDPGLGDAGIARLVGATTVRIDANCDTTFPAKRRGRIALVLTDGQRLDSGLVEASGGPDPQPDAATVIAKYRRYAEPVLGRTRAAVLETAILNAGLPGA
ncbi:MAG: MmgE/PrpD family protein, partial [Rhodospirillaceae bacterium]|nr:MmgE/PrpD family protein [Rhodospirillaceae bacterium]